MRLLFILQIAVCFSQCTIIYDHHRLDDRTPYLHDYSGTKISVIDTITVVKPYIYAYNFKDLGMYYQVIKNRRFEKLKFGLDTIAKETNAKYMFQTYYYSKLSDFLLKKKKGTDFVDLNETNFIQVYEEFDKYDLKFHKEEIKQLSLSPEIYEIVKGLKGRYSIFTEGRIYSNTSLKIPGLAANIGIPEYYEYYKMYLIDKKEKKIIYYDNIFQGSYQNTPGTWGYYSIDVLIKGLGKYFD